jgi:hypothetical protein
MSTERLCSQQIPTRSRRATLQLLAVALFMGINVAVPMVVEDLYPFTSVPMFRDQPTRYCNYSVYDPNGRRLPSEDFLLQRVYDGNPPGVGIGIQPPAVLERKFGEVASRSQVVQHVCRELSKRPDVPFVIVVQDVVGANVEGRIGVLRSNRWKISRGDGL